MTRHTSKDNALQLCIQHVLLGGQGGTRLEFSWHNEFRSIDTDEHINSAEDEDGQDDGKVTDEFPHLRQKKTHGFDSVPSQMSC